MNSIERLDHIVGVIFDPRFWVRSGPVDHSWSSVLDELMDKNAEVIPSDGNYIFLDNRFAAIWIRGRDYFWFGTWYGYGDYSVPRRKTAIRLRKYITEYCVDQLRGIGE